MSATKSHFSPNGARFDSPGRLALGSRTQNRHSPEGARFPRVNDKFTHPGISPRWGSRILDAIFPGLTRPGLSNLAPVGADALTAGIKGAYDLPFQSLVSRARQAPPRFNAGQCSD